MKYSITAVICAFIAICGISYGSNTSEKRIIQLECEPNNNRNLIRCPTIDYNSIATSFLDNFKYDDATNYRWSDANKFVPFSLIKHGHEQDVLNILLNSKVEDLAALLPLKSRMYCRGGLYDKAYRWYTFTIYDDRPNYKSSMKEKLEKAYDELKLMSLNAKEELTVVLAEYEKIIIRMGLREHLIDGTLLDKLRMEC